MVRRNRKKILKLVLTICAAVFFGGLFLKAAVTSLELSTSVMVAIEHDRMDAFMTRIPGMAGFQQTKVSSYSYVYHIKRIHIYLNMGV